MAKWDQNEVAIVEGVRCVWLVPSSLSLPYRSSITEINGSKEEGVLWGLHC